MDNNLMFSSAYDAWATPKDFFDKLNSIYNFDIDVCASKDIAKCAHYFTKEQDCLKIDWFGYGIENFDAHPVCWMNPPYGRGMDKFVKKAYEESVKGCTVVILLPARTCTKWFHEYALKGKIEFIKGRLIFGSDSYWEWVWEQPILNGKKNSLYKKYGKRNPAPFPSLLVIFNP